MACQLCNEVKYNISYLPSTRFNDKIFEYRGCASCKLIYLYPLPTPDDYLKMYPPQYQNGIDDRLQINPEKKLPGLRFSYQVHWDLINRYKPNGRILDYGCGSANFIVNSLSKGYICDGAEYNPTHVEILNSNNSNAKFYQIEDILTQKIEARYDVIRLSNVFEHLDKPIEVIDSLKKLLNEDGIFLIEGPLENNPNLAWWIRKFYFKIKKKVAKNKLETHAPTHIIFTNATNQKTFFEKAGLIELYFEVTESEWPFPSKEFVKTKGDRIKNYIARLSMVTSNLFKNKGNTFIYVGRK